MQSKSLLLALFGAMALATGAFASNIKIDVSGSEKNTDTRLILKHAFRGTDAEWRYWRTENDGPACSAIGVRIGREGIGKAVAYGSGNGSKERYGVRFNGEPFIGDVGFIQGDLDNLSGKWRTSATGGISVKYTNGAKASIEVNNTKIHKQGRNNTHVMGWIKHLHNGVQYDVAACGHFEARNFNDRQLYMAQVFDKGNVLVRADYRTTSGSLASQANVVVLGNPDASYSGFFDDESEWDANYVGFPPGKDGPIDPMRFPQRSMGTEDAERASSFAARFGYATDSKGEAARTYRVAVYPGWLSHVDMPVIDKTYVSSEFGDFKPIYRAGTTIGGVKCLVEKNEETNSLGTRVAYEFVPKKE